MKTWLTEYLVNGQRFGDEIEAHDRDEAQALCNVRGRGEKVIGEQLGDPIPFDVDTNPALWQKTGKA